MYALAVVGKNIKNVMVVNMTDSAQKIHLVKLLNTIRYADGEQ